MKRLLAIATSALMACAFAGPATAGGPNPSAFVLKLGDVPSGFTVNAQHVVTNATAAAEDGRPLSLYAKWGRLTGYEVDFGRVPGSRNGPVAIASVANMYKTAKGASSSLVGSKTLCRQAPFKTLSLSARIGNAAVLCRAATASDGVTLEVYALTWRRGNLKLSIVTAGIRGRLSAADAVRLAEKLDHRIHSHNAATRIEA